MAQSQSDLFSFLITPEFDTQGVDDSYKLLETKLKKVAEKISGQISQAMGQGFQFPAGFEKDNLGQVIKLVESLGGSIKRAGTDITSSFKDANGTIVTLKQNIKDAVDIAESLELNKAGTDLQKAAQISEKYAQLRSSGDTYTSSEQLKDVENLISLIQKEDEAYTKLQQSQKTGNKIIEDYYNAVYKTAVEERNLAETDFTQKYGNMGQVPQLWQEVADRLTKVNELQQKQSAMDEEYQKQANEVKNFKEALDGLVEAQKKIDSLWAQGKGDTDEFQVALAQYQAAKSTLEGYGATVDATSVSITKQSKIVQQNQTAYEELDKATKEATVDITKANAQMGDATAAKVQQAAIKDFESALSKLVSTRKRMNELESQKKTDTQEYKVLAQQYETAKTKLEGYGATVTDTSVKITQNSQVVNGNSEAFEKESKKCQEASDSLAIHKARSEDSANSQNTFSQSIQSSVENFIKYQVAMEAINKITSEFTSAIYDMNEAMTQVRMVTMGSYEDTVALADSYTKLAKQLGTTTTTVAEGADAWLRQGYSAQDAMEMLKQSTTLAVVGQLNASEATDQLTA
nr:MAG TPA: minor tail protein [Caudoviricetes sp.]